MKKLICIILSIAISTSALFAQSADKKAKPTTTQKAEKPAKAAPEKAPKTKKDGTPDKRFKENKVVKPQGPTKKDGTPDMRHKVNKEAAKKEVPAKK